MPVVGVHYGKAVVSKAHIAVAYYARVVGTSAFHSGVHFLNRKKIGSHGEICRRKYRTHSDHLIFGFNIYYMPTSVLRNGKNRVKKCAKADLM